MLEEISTPPITSDGVFTASYQQMIQLQNLILFYYF